MAHIQLSNLPSSWAEFNREKRLNPTANHLSALNRFGYRYRLAHSFNGLSAEGIGRSLLTYSAITKLFFAYTAYESLIPSAKRLRSRGVEPIAINVLFDKDIADKLRENIKLKDFLLNYGFKDELKSKLNHFFSESTHDIICVAYAIRNMFAHGDLTTTDIGTGTAKERKLLLLVADRILVYCDEVFSDCVLRLQLRR